MPLSEEQAVKKVDDLKKAWEVRNRNFEEFYKLREMHDPRKRPQELSIALNDARTFLDLSVHMLAHRPPVKRVPVLGQPEAQQEASGGAEIFLHGIDRKIDSDRFDMGLMPWRYSHADFACTTGWWADKNLVLKNSDNTPDFISEVLDPAQVFPEFGFRMTTAIAHVYPTNLAEVQEKAALFDWEGNFSGDGQQEVDINDLYWWEDDMVWNAVIVRQPKRGRDNDRIFAIPPMPREGLDRIPMRTGPVGGWAVRSSRPSTAKQQQHYGESILAAGAPVFDMKNAFATIVLRKAQESINPLVGIRSNSGRWTVSEDDLRSGVGIPMARDQDIEMKERPGLTNDVVNGVMPMLESAVRRAGANDLLLGVVNPNDLAGAGFALSLLEPRLLSQLIPYAQTLEHIGASRDSYFLSEFRRGDFAPIKLVSRNDEARDIRKVFYQEWSPSDLPETDLVMWEVQLSMPDQLQQQISIARQAKPEGDLLDDDTLLERVLKVDDIHRVKTAIRDARIQRHPAIQAVEAVHDMEMYAENLREEMDAFRAAGEDKAADLTERTIRRIERIIETSIQQLEGNRQQPQGPPGQNPQTFGVQATRAANGTLTPAQGAPGVPRG